MREGSRDLLEGDYLPYERIYLFRLVEAYQFVVGLMDQVRHYLAVQAPMETYYRIVLYEQVVGRGLGDSTPREPDDDYASLEGHAPP